MVDKYLTARYGNVELLKYFWKLSKKTEKPDAVSLKKIPAKCFVFVFEIYIVVFFV